MPGRTVIFTAVLIVVIASVLTFDPVAAQDGEAVFNALRCGSCHKPDAKAAGASLNEIVKVYADQEKLVRFFKGETKPVIETDKPGMMKGQMPKIMALSEGEKKALVQYIFRFR